MKSDFSLLSCRNLSTAAWLIPLLISGIDIGIVIARKF